MKMLAYFLFGVLILSSCGSDKPVEEKQPTPQIPAPAMNKPVRGPLTFPFSIDLASLSEIDSKKYTRDGCNTTIRRWENDPIRMITDTLDCYEAGGELRYYLFEHEEITVFQFRSVKILDDGRYLLQDEIYDFKYEPYYQHTRRDTLQSRDFGQLQQAYQSEIIENSKSVIVAMTQNFMERWSFEGN